jgi:coenzyme F420 hydrogenase subunit beta
MLSKKSELIAYNDLERLIIKPGFCTLCGACEAACPIHTIKIGKTGPYRIHDCSGNLDLCPICYEICPHSEALLLRSMKFVANAPIKSETMGYYRKIVLAQGVDSKLREQSHGGAVVTSLLTYGVEKKVFDSAIVSQAQSGTPTLPRPSIALVPDDVLSSVGSKFFPSPVAKAYGSAVYEYGKSKIAFVGVPCHVLALRKMEAWQHKIIDNLKITIGLFCFGTFSQSQMLEHLTKKYKINPSEIRRMRLSSKFLVQTENDVIQIPLSEIKEHIMPSCRTCMDFTAELADISVGAAYPLKDWSTVIIRTKTGEEFFYDAVKNGVVSTSVIESEPNIIERVMMSAIQKRTNALEAAKNMEQVYGHLPIRLLRETDELANVKGEEIMTRNITSVPHNLTISQFLDVVAKHHHMGYPVTDEKGEIIGLVTLEKASEVEKEKREKTLISDIAGRLVTASLGETALTILRRMTENETGRIIVFDPSDTKKPLGIVTKTDLMHAIIQ